MKRQAMDQIWLASPAPAVWLERGGAEWRVNRAALAWAGRCGFVEPDPWRRFAQTWRAALGSDQNEGELATPAVAWRAIEVGAGWLIWLTPLDTAEPAELARSAQPWRSAADKLELVQTFAAIGMFERNAVTYEARWDAQMFRLFGLPPRADAPSFEAMLERIAPDDRDRFRSEFARHAREGGRRTVRFGVVWDDGSRHDLLGQLDVRPAADGTAPTIIGVVCDETDGAGRVRAQQAVNQHLARALRLAKVSVWRIDFASNRIYYEHANDEQITREMRVHGVDVAELRSWVHPDDVAAIEAADRRAVSGSEVIDLEARYRTDELGTYRTLSTRRVADRDEHGRVIGLLGITVDPPEREHIQALQRQTELVADAAQLGVWSIDESTGEVEWNAQMFRIYGARRDQLPATLREWRDVFVHPEDRAPLTEARERNVAARSTAFETEFRIVRADGTVRWVASRSRREQHGGRSVLIGIHLDTTETMLQRQRAEQALREKEDALRASQAKSDFLSRASHELRTPLNAVLGFAQLIEHEGAGVPLALQLERVAHIRTAGEHLLALVDDVLDLAAIEAGSLVVASAPVFIDEVLVDVAGWLASLASRAGVTIHVQRCGGWVRGDSRRLRQIIANLLSNAVKFNRAGGSAWLGAERRGAAWQITVRDDGRGIAPAQCAHLFEAFQRLGAEREGIQGLGLGLVIVRQLAALMEGSIGVESTPGQGSEFRVTLAAVDAAVPPVAIPNEVLLKRPPREGAARFELVYIEDNAVNAVLVEGLVALRPGANLRVAVDGVSGVALALAVRPQVVLIDMQLPDIDGFEVLRRLRAAPSLAATRLIALSANGLSDDIARAMSAGFDDYWTKPIDFKLFLGRLDALMAQAGARAH